MKYTSFKSSFMALCLVTLMIITFPAYAVILFFNEKMADRIILWFENKLNYIHRYDLK